MGSVVGLGGEFEGCGGEEEAERIGGEGKNGKEGGREGGRGGREELRRK